eukprot:COSAG03_NODE_15382_length_432_cov_1.222222_1_plen_59_part_10
MGAKDSPKKAPDAPKGGQKRARSTEEKPEKAQKLTGARRIAVDLEWTAQQYAKYEVFRQ